MASVEDIVAMARSVRERANDLRALEVLAVSPESPGVGGMPITVDDIGGWNDTGPQRWEQWKSEYNLDAAGVDSSRFGAEFDYIPSMFEQLAFADSDDYNTVLAQLDAVSKTLYPDDFEFVETPTLKAIQRLDSDWVGTSADAYRDFFADKLPNLIPSQKRILQEVAAAVKSHWNIVEAGRESLLSIATETHDALQNAHQQYQQGGTPEFDLTAVLQMTGSVLAIAGSLISPPAGAFAITAALVAGVNQGGSLASAALGQIEYEDQVEKKETPIPGSTVDEIISAMHSAITALQQHVVIEEEAQSIKLLETYNDLEKQLSNSDHTAKDSYILQCYRPPIADSIPELGSDQWAYAQ